MKKQHVLQMTFFASLAITAFSSVSAQQQLTIFTDADAGVREVCRWDNPEDVCLVPRGGEHDVIDEWDDHPRYMRVHDQNAMDVAYLHFDLAGLPQGATVTDAKFQLDAQSNSWGDTSVMVVAIVDESEDWDLNAIPENEIYGENAPKLEWSDWEDDPTPDINRFNTPTPFLDEGPNRDDAVRQLVDDVEPIFIETTDIDSEGTVDDPGNSYGGYACCEVGDGGGGSTDGGDNPWPIKNAIDIDVTSLIQWKLGQNTDYSTYTASDRELTMMVRTEIPENQGGNGFARFVARESEYLGGDLDLQPGRLLVSYEGGGLVGDFNLNGMLDLPDIDDLTAQSAAGTNPATYDLNADTLVNDGDITVWAKDLFGTWIGDANLDGEFNSNDLVVVLAAGTYETGGAAVWSEGDFDGDGLANTNDLVFALADGGYEQGPLAATAAVPEPASVVLTLIGIASLIASRRRHAQRVEKLTD